MNWNRIAEALTKEAGLPRALQDPAVQERLIAALRAPQERDRLGARSALLRTRAHAHGREAAVATHQERAIGRSMSQLEGSGREIPPATWRLAEQTTQRAQEAQTAGERSRRAGKALAGLVEPRHKPLRLSLRAAVERVRDEAAAVSDASPAGELSDMRPFYGRAPEPAAASTVPAPARLGGSSGGSASGGRSGNGGRNAALAAAAAALLGGGAYLWMKRKRRQEAERTPEERWATAEV